MTDGAAPVYAIGQVPRRLIDEFWRYDEALLRDDRESMDDLFAPGPNTLRGDGTRLLVGHDAISSFRASRARTPTRRVTALHVRMLADDLAVIVAPTVEPSTGAPGLQTQLWRLGNGTKWEIELAHVSSPYSGVAAPARRGSTGRDTATSNPAVWRVLGAPLIRGGPGGPLTGLRLAVKDVYAVAGQTVGAGVPDWEREQRPQGGSAPVVQALLDAGAEVTGIAQTDEFAYSIAGVNAHYGAAPNPAAPHAVAGGSSSGPASAVSLHQADIGLGTDTAGSIRVPASYQGLVGIRTSHGRLPMASVLGLAPDFDTVGWLTRDAATAIAVADVLLPRKTDRSLCLRRTITVPQLDAHVIPAVRSSFRQTVAHLIEHNQLPPLQAQPWSSARLEEWFRSFRIWQAWQAWHTHGRWIAEHPGSLGADVAQRFQHASTISLSEARIAQQSVAEGAAVLRSVLAEAILVLPSTATPAPPRSATAAQLDECRSATLKLSCLAPIAGAPAVSVPVMAVSESWRAGATPVGLCLIGAAGTDRDLLNLAQRLETALLPGDRNGELR